MVPSVIFIVLLAGVAIAKDKTVNINDIVDLKLQLANKIRSQSNTTLKEYGDGHISTISYKGAVGVGLDSLYRTGNCTMKFNGNSIAYVYNIGQKLLATFFSKAILGDTLGSGYYTCLNNSLEYSYTVNYQAATCRVRLNTLQLSLNNVTLYIQDKMWDSEKDNNFQNFIQQEVLPGINNALQAKSINIEDGLQSIFCQKSSYSQSPTGGLDVLRSFLFE